MKILVACEFSGTVREAFKARGHDAWSCDLLPTEIPGQHYQSDVREVLVKHSWDLVIAHPPCTYLTNAGVRWLYENGRGQIKNRERWEEMYKGADFFSLFLQCTVKKVAIENPIMHSHARNLVGPPSQIIQPWQFSHKESKATCLWLSGLPPLVPTDIVGPPPEDKIERHKWARVHRASPGPNRWKERSRTFTGIAQAMADQWG